MLQNFDKLPRFCGKAAHRLAAAEKGVKSCGVLPQKFSMGYKYRNGLWPMQYVFLIRSCAGGKKYVTRLRLVTLHHHLSSPIIICCCCCYCYRYYYYYYYYYYYSAPPRDIFLTAGARAYQKHVLHGPETVSIFILNGSEVGHFTKSCLKK